MTSKVRRSTDPERSDPIGRPPSGGLSASPGLYALGSASGMAQFLEGVRGGEAVRHDRDQRRGDARALVDDAEEVLAGDPREHRIGGCRHGGRPWPMFQQTDLAEVVALRQRGDY